MAPPAASAPIDHKLRALLRRAGLEHLGKILAAEEINMKLLQAMDDLGSNLSELAISDDEVRRLEAALHPKLSAEVDSDGEDGELI